MRYLFFLLLIAFCFPSPLVAQTDVSPQIALFEKNYNSAHTHRAVFLERYFENDSLVRLESGIAYFRKPGKMRWEYEKPERNLFLVDGKTAWFYTPVDRTVTRVPAHRSNDWRTPLTFLAGDGKLSRVCARVSNARLPTLPDTSLPASSASGFECILKGAAKSARVDSHGESATRVFLEVSDKGELARVLVQSPGSVLTEFRFKDWEVNPSLADTLFRFSPPPGVVIVDGLLPSLPSARQ